MADTTIEWTDKVWNPVTGLDQPLRWKESRRIFVNGMSDLFHEDVGVDFIQSVFDVMERAKWHTFQILTKRVDRMARLVPHFRQIGGIKQIDRPLPNVHLGVSCEDQETFDERWPVLRATPAAVKFISYEPALSSLSLDKRMMQPDWVICGGEIGPHARPMHPDWARSMRDQCRDAGVPFFFKQWGEWVSVSEIAGPGEHYHFPDGATVRRTGKKRAGAMLDGREWKEFPKGASVHI